MHAIPLFMEKNQMGTYSGFVNIGAAQAQYADFEAKLKRIVERRKKEQEEERLLDYFAAKAMQGMLANPIYDMCKPLLANESYEIAAEMVARRNET